MAFHLLQSLWGFVKVSAGIAVMVTASQTHQQQTQLSDLDE